MGLYPIPKVLFLPPQPIEPKSLLFRLISANQLEIEENVNRAIMQLSPKPQMSDEHRAQYVRSSSGLITFVMMTLLSQSVVLRHGISTIQRDQYLIPAQHIACTPLIY